MNWTLVENNGALPTDGSLQSKSWVDVVLIPAAFASTKGCLTAPQSIPTRTMPVALAEMAWRIHESHAPSVSNLPSQRCMVHPSVVPPAIAPPDSFAHPIACWPQ